MCFTDHVAQATFSFEELVVLDLTYDISNIQFKYAWTRKLRVRCNFQKLKFASEKKLLACVLFEVKFS